jgi:hypothetical protein
VRPRLAAAALGVVPLLLLVITGCSGPGAAPPAAATAAPLSAGAVPERELSTLLLQAGDVPGLQQQRPFVSAALTTQATPQLALCREPAPVAPHELASVLAKPARPGDALVFEIVSVFRTGPEAVAAFQLAVADEQACRTYSSAGHTFSVSDSVTAALPGTQGTLQYRLTTPDVISGDVRTLAVKGKSLVLLTGYGAAPGGQDLLAYQRALMVTSLTRASAAG